jgi:Putative DNA-binding domain
MTLAETQALFHQLLTRGPHADPVRLDACFVGTADLPAADRVDIYAGMFIARQVEALREELPKLAAFLGEDRFHGLCEAYLREHPSEHHDIGKLGRNMAAFLRRYPDPDRPDLADLAELELARNDVFFDAGASSVGREALGSLPQEAFVEVRLRFAPALRVLVQDHDGASLWRQLERGDGGGPVARGPVAVAVWRSGYDVFHTGLDLDEAVAVESALAGEPLSRVCAAFARREDPAGAAFAALSSWFEEGWVAGIDVVQGLPSHPGRAGEM